MVFLRIKLDFLLIEAQLLANKPDKAKLLITKMLSYNVIKYDNLQFLTGFLFFAAKIVRPDRTFFRRFFHALVYC